MKIKYVPENERWILDLRHSGWYLINPAILAPSHVWIFKIVFFYIHVNSISHQVEQWVTLLLAAGRSWVQIQAWNLTVWSLHVLPVHMWILSGHSAVPL